VQADRPLYMHAALKLIATCAAGIIIAGWMVIHIDPRIKGQLHFPMISCPLTPALKRILILTLLVVQSGCTLALKENRRLLNKTDTWVQPESNFGRIASAPLCIPLATSALALDVALVHPAASIAPAAQDMQGIFWDTPDDDWGDRMVMFPFRSVGTALLYPPDWIGRSLMLPIPSDPAVTGNAPAGLESVE
jgi:hypothetical protein